MTSFTSTLVFRYGNTTLPSVGPLPDILRREKTEKPATFEQGRIRLIDDTSSDQLQTLMWSNVDLGWHYRIAFEMCVSASVPSMVIGSQVLLETHIKQVDPSSKRYTPGNQLQITEQNNPTFRLRLNSAGQTGLGKSQDYNASLWADGNWHLFEMIQNNETIEVKVDGKLSISSNRREYMMNQGTYVALVGYSSLGQRGNHDIRNIVCEKYLPST